MSGYIGMAPPGARSLAGELQSAAVDAEVLARTVARAVAAVGVRASAPTELLRIAELLRRTADELLGRVETLTGTDLAPAGPISLAATVTGYPAVAAKVAGALGLTLEIGELARALESGDSEAAVATGATASGSALMLTGHPVAVGAGATLVVAGLAYENRGLLLEVASGSAGWLGQGTAWAGDRFERGASATWDWTGGRLGDAGELIVDGGELVVDAVSFLNPFD